MRRNMLGLLAGAIGLALIGLACWLVAGIAADRMVRQNLLAAMSAQRAITSSIVDNMARMIATDLALSRAIPATIAEIDAVQRALDHRYTPSGHPQGSAANRRTALRRVPELAALDSFLQQSQGFSGLDALWLVDAQGVAVASSNADLAQSFVGIDMRSRRFVSGALLGAFSEAYGVGKITGMPGIYVSAPVYRNGRLVGAVVAKVGITRLRHWVAHAGTFVTDENGVIVMAHDTSLDYHSTPLSGVARMSAAQRRDTYHRESFPALAVQSLAASIAARAPWVPGDTAHDLFAVQGDQHPALLQVRGGSNSGLTSYIVDPFTAWQDLQRTHQSDRLLVFLVMFGSAGFVIVLLVSYSRERRLHRAARDLAKQLQAANQLLFDEARHDVLTGALSRRYFIDLLTHEIQRAQAAAEPLCVAIADLDHFKLINDSLGHATGDFALEHFVQACRSVVGENDAIGRLGGEEFGILLPLSTLASALELAEQIRVRFRETHGVALPSEVFLSVSMGVAELLPDDVAERILSRADQALYVAKALGRDRSTAFSAEAATHSESRAASTLHMRG